MKVFNLPKLVRGLVFDIDNTLYRDPRYVKAQTDLLVARLARERGDTFDRVWDNLEQYREDEAKVRGGRRPSLGNSFLHFGIPIEQSVRWREEELDPERYLSEDPELDRLLGDLGRAYRLVCVTNNPSSIGRRTLAALGVSERIETIIGLDSTLVSKPNILPFRMAAEAVDCLPREMISIGDRYEVDLEPAIEIGMGGILVEDRQDLFRLPLPGPDIDRKANRS